MPTEHIARRTVAFFLLTSLANVGVLAVFAAAFAVGLLGHDEVPGVTYGFGIAALASIPLTLVLPALTARLEPTPGDGGGRVRTARLEPTPGDGGGRVRTAIRAVVSSVGHGVRDSLTLLRTRQTGVLSGSLGYMGFDIAVLWACYRAFGHSPSLGVLVVAYIIGQLGGLLPIPGGIGGTEGGLIGTFALYHAPLATTAVAVLAYRAVQLWLPALLGSLAFLQLRNSLRQEAVAGAMCAPLSEGLEVVKLPVRA
jgi:hypothetical protein